MPSNGLSARQFEIVSPVAEGLDNKTIARQLDISNKTVKNHLTVVFRKINVRSRTQAALWVIRQGALPARVRASQ